MKNSFILIVLLLISFWSFGQRESDLNYKNSDRIAFNLIQLCVDSTLHLDRGLNSRKYRIDFGSAVNLNREGIETFLKLNSAATETNLDSLISHDSIWIKYQYFQNTIIKFEKIMVQKDGSILIHTTKTMSSDGAIGVEILVQKDGDKFKCMFSKIRWIS